jgi:FecR protein
MRAESSMSFDVVGHRSAITRLSKGELRVDVRHAERADWRFFAGPFEVRVVGTKFDLAWRDDKLTVAMREGRVRIVGPDREWTVAAGERFEMTGRGALANLAPHPATAEVTAPDQPKPTLPSGQAAETAASDERISGRVSSKEDTAPGTAARGAKPLLKVGGEAATDSASRTNDSLEKSEGWQQLLAKGEFGTLLSEAKAVGIDAAIQTRSSGELVALAQAARYSKEAGLARKVWQGVRGRFAGSLAARDAAFFLARVDEQAGRQASALELYRSYLREGGQSGAYAPEAMGRRLVLLRRSNLAAAVDEAQQYLARFPSGPYAKLARDTVGSQR